MVFMDCQMPQMDGYEAVQRLRSDERPTGRHIPVIALTANVMPGAIERCLAAGMDDYIAKPVRLQDMEAALARWLPQESASS